MTDFRIESALRYLTRERLVFVYAPAVDEDDHVDARCVLEDVFEEADKVLYVPVASALPARSGAPF